MTAPAEGPASELICDESATASVYSEPSGPVPYFSVHGYLVKSLRLTRSVNEAAREHCLRVLWPGGSTNSDGRRSQVAETIDGAWFRAVANTLARVPWEHVLLLRRLVIDNRPTEHGIAAFDRGKADDARDGRTIWLHEHLFRAPNHWARGNHGSYWSYHVNEDGVTFDGMPAEHDAFSPVLLHELGHLVMYHRINPAADPLSAPVCAWTCADSGTCSQLGARAREDGCVSPYCSPFGFPGSTENWAEQYRFHYQSAATRALLAGAGSGCAAVLAGQDGACEERSTPPWHRGLPDIQRFRRSLWDSCGGRACKPF
jgi:hypothetical protein